MTVKWNPLGNTIFGGGGDQSGRSVSLSSDGTIVAIGAPFNDGSGDSSGHVRVYEYEESSGTGTGTWTQLGGDIDGEAVSDQSGYSVSLSSDGRIVAIGTPYNDGSGDSAGHVRVYEYEESSGTGTGTGTGTWKKLGGDIDGEAKGDYSGWSVSLSSIEERTIVAIGAKGNDGSGADSGHVRVYEYEESSGTGTGTGTGTWTQLGGDIDGEAAGDNSGYSVSLSSDGTIVAIGAIKNDGSGNGSRDNRGHVRVYEYEESSGTGTGTWTQLGGDIYGEAQRDQSGYSVSLSSDGTIVAIGAPRNGGGGNFSGHVRVYELTVLGCTDELATNYDETATKDDGSCEYEESDICFYAGSMVKTDKGYKAIEEIDVKRDRINGKEIVIWTKTKNIEDEIIVMKEGSLSDGVPNKETRITQQHKIKIGEELIEAWSLEERNENIYRERYDGSYVYNIGLKEHGKMEVNGMIVETLNPMSRISKRMILRMKEGKMRKMLGGR